MSGTATIFNKRVQKSLAFLETRMTADASRPPRLTKAYLGLLGMISTDRSDSIAVASRLIGGKHPWDRFFAATLFGSLCNPVEKGEEEEADKIIDLLSKAADSENSSAVLVAIAHALGYPYRSSALPALMKLSYHQDENVRYAATSSLPSAFPDNPPADSIKRLLELMRDKDPDVRDWATFGLGTQLQELDSTEIRQGLLERTRDRHRDTSAEAFMGLAYRHDEAGSELLLQRLERAASAGSQIGALEIEAAGTYGLPKYHGHLLEIAKWWGKDEKLEWAIARTDIDRRKVANVPTEWTASEKLQTAKHA